MDFGKALELLKKGQKVARKGWNGRGMFVVYQKGYPQGIPCNKQTAEAWESKRAICLYAIRTFRFVALMVLIPCGFQASMIALQRIGL